MTVGFRIESRETNTEKDHHKNDKRVKCQNEKDSVACSLFEAAYVCLEGRSFFLLLVKYNVFNVDRVRKIPIAEALCHVC